MLSRCIRVVFVFWEVWFTPMCSLCMSPFIFYCGHFTVYYY